MSFVFPVLALAAATSLAGFMWWTMARRPVQWAKMVERENDFWRGRGWISAQLAERVKRWETSRALRWLAGAATLLGAIGLIMTTVVLARVIALEHQKPRMPYNPALHQKPVKPDPKAAKRG